ncbi:MAG: hypothetical protein LBD49_03690 [Oscillospiraceae bacterium]|nr:hypothetical protein [Oscillospiraceae bacterium]
MKKRKKRGGGTDAERYMNSMHTLGRLGAAGAVVILIGMPVALGLIFNAMPRAGETLRAALPLLAIFLPSNLFEVLTYTPVFGSAVYLTLITGEVVNLKLPVLNSVMGAMKAEPGSQEADVLAVIAVCAASLVTAAVVAAGIALMAPLRPILTAPVVRTASANIVPALFGALLAGVAGRELGGGVTARGRLLGLFPAAALTALITVFDGRLSAFLGLDKLMGQEGGVIIPSFRSFVIIALLPVTYFFGKWMYKRGYIAVALPGETLNRRGRNR